MRIRPAALLLTSLALTLGAPGRPPAYAATTPLELPTERYTLPSGLRVVLREQHRLPTVVVDLLFQVGSKDETPGRSGFAHLFEHLMFMGTSGVPKGEFDRIMEESGGENNAWTSPDSTNYFDLGPSHLLETFLWLEADRLAGLPQAMTQAKLDLQREVVRNERQQEVDNVPYGQVELLVPAALYPPGHPYQHSVYGTIADLEAATVSDVVAFFRRYYVPSNAILVVSGDFAPAAARQLIDKYFGSMPRRPVPTHAAPKQVALGGPVRREVTDRVELPRVVMVFHAPPAFAEGSAECSLLAALLGGGTASRLHRALVYEQRLAESVEVELIEGRFGSELRLVATARSGHSAAEVEAALRGEIGRLREAAPPTIAELERSRAWVETHLLEELESPTRLAAELASFEALLGDAALLQDRYLGRFASITAHDLGRWARTLFGAAEVTIAISGEAARR